MTSILDVTSMLDRNQAKKLLAEILRKSDTSTISLTKHCRLEMKHDSLTTVDIFNVLKGGHIYNPPEFEKGTYRYRVETPNIIVVIAFGQPHFIRCITAWRK